jgi:hypothetical protein
MNKRIKVTIFAACALLMCLMATSAFAVNATSYVDYGSSSWDTSGSQTLLDTDSLSGQVVSQATSTGTATQVLRGEMWTKGAVFSVQRSFKEVAPKATDNLPGWSNPSSEKGTFFSKAHAQNGNHNGYCRVSN